MKATRILMDEHRVIERVLTALSWATDRLERGNPIETSFFLEAADFIKNFADGLHHQKEEGILFGAMEAAGVPKKDGPIGCMLSEHEQARAYTRHMREAAEKLQTGNEQARPVLIRNARDYVALLRDHIAKEDQVLFPMADQVIPTSGQVEEIEAEFERIAREHASTGTFEKYHALAEKLERQAQG